MKRNLLKIIGLLLAAVTVISVMAGCSGGDAVTETDTAAETTGIVTGTDVVTADDVTTDDAATTVFTDTETEPATDTETQTDAATETTTAEETAAADTTTVPETTEEVTTEKETTAPETTEEVTTEKETTAQETTAPETTKEEKPKTDAPVVLESKTIGPGRVLVYGTAEPDSVIRTSVNGAEMKNKCKNKYFYIEIGTDKKADVSLYATADGKTESKETKITVTPTGDQTSVWGGKDSRLFYTETLNYLIGNRPDETSLTQITGYITKKTVTEIQKVTGKKTKLIYAIIPDPATAYYDEQFKYIADSVLDPSTSAMCSFTKKLNGMHEDVYAIDLFSVMRAHKNEDIYFTTDTHYTELGAYYANLEIMKTVQKDNPSAKVRTIEKGDYKVYYSDVDGGDLCSMAGIKMKEVVPFFDALFEDTGSYYISKRNDGIKSANFNPGSWERNSELKSSSNPTAYFIADSYGCYILPFIGANFSKVWTNEGVLWNFELNKTILEQNKPDYVIILVCQRNVLPDFMDASNRIRIASMSVQGF